MWQRHGMKFSEFFALSEEERLVYIASENYYNECREKAIEAQKGK